MNIADIADHLKKMRASKGLLQRDIADALSVDTSTITHIERGTRLPSIDVLFRWISVCGGTLQILGAGDVADPLASLSPQQRAVMEAMQEMDVEDAGRLVGVARALRTTDGLARDLLVGQLDGIVGATRKSSGSERAERKVG